MPQNIILPQLQQAGILPRRRLLSRSGIMLFMPVDFKNIFFYFFCCHWLPWRATMRPMKPIQISSDLHQRAKIEAAHRGVSLKELVEEALREYLRKPVSC